jgi:cytochrome c-type biogenesis protein CcmF
MAPPLDRVAFYNKWQLPFAILSLITIGISLLLRYGKNDIMEFLRKLGISLLFSTVLFAAELWLFQVQGAGMLLFLFSGNFAMIASLDFFFRNKNGIYNLSNSVTHFGFGLMMLGIIVAFSTSQVISTNTSRYDLGDAEMNRENQLLIKNEAKELGPYFVKYTNLRREQNHLYYTLDFMTKDASGQLQHTFTLTPTINVNSRMGNVYNPDTYHSLTKDVYTFISYADIMADIREEEYKTLITQEMSKGDTLPVSSYLIVLDSIYVRNQGPGKISVDNVRIIASLSLLDKFNHKHSAEVAYIIEEGTIKHENFESDDLGIRLSFDNIGKTPGSLMLKVDEKRLNYIVVKTTVFPYISIMWIGVLIMFAGLAISFYRNTRISLK